MRSLIIATVLMLALAPGARAAAEVHGCSVDLTHDGASSVSIDGPAGTDLPPVAFDGDTVVLDDPDSFPAGAYVATWDDGTVDRFELGACVVPTAEPQAEPDPTADPTAAPVDDIAKPPAMAPPPAPVAATVSRFARTLRLAL